MTEPIIAEFIGGPRDGEIMELPDLRTRWLFPAPLDLVASFTSEELFPTYIPRVLAYDLALDPVMRRPSLSDAGRYRYEFVGER